MATKDIYEKGRQAANMGNYDYAIELFREVLRHDPENSEARLLLRGTERRRKSERTGIANRIGCRLAAVIPIVRAAVFCKGPQKKLEYYEDALESLPESKFIAVRAGKAARNAGFADASISIFKDVIARFPEDKKSLRHAGEILEEQGETREALKFLNRLQQLCPSDIDLTAQVKNLEAEAHMKESKMEEAESFRDMIKDKEVAEESVKRFETTEERRSTQIQKALEELKKEPDNVNKVIRLASLLEENKKEKKALQLLGKAQQRQPDNFDIRQKMGDLEMRLLSRKEQELKNQLAENPDSRELRAELDEISSKRRETALREYKWRIQKHPTDRELKLKLGHALFEAGETDHAIASFQQAGQSTNLELEAAGMLGKCFALKKQYDLAAEQFRRALGRHSAMDNKGMGLYYDLASVLEAAGNTQEALDIYKRLYSHDIGFRDAANKVEELSKGS